MLIKKPLKIGNLTLKNRFVMSSMATGYPELSGLPNERFIKYLERRAIGGVAMTIIESTGVVDYFRYNIRTPSIANDESIPYWKKLVDSIHAQDCLVCIQLQHPGRQIYSVSIGETVGASAVPTRLTGIVPRALNVAEIKEMVEAFGDGAKRAQQAGIDAVEIHGGHGYLFSQFLSTSSNIRDDEYGGSLVNRFRFLKEVIQNIKLKTGEDYPIIVRLSFEEFTGEGITLDETLQVAKWLEELGVSSIRVSGGSLDQSIPAMIPPTDVQKGLFWGFSKIAKEHLNIPVDIVGRIQTPELAEELLQEGYADYISLGRPLIADPDYVNKAISGESFPIRPCIACNQGCIDRLLNHDIGEIGCLVNHEVGREWQLPTFPVFETEPQKVVVVGAGPAGLEAARVAASKGHQVTLIERQADIGGTFSKAVLPPGKQDFKALLSYYKRELNRLKVSIRLNETPDAATLHALQANYVIWAIGSNKEIAERVQVDKKLMCEDAFTTVLDGKLNVIVYGGKWEGVETALYLKSLGHKVTIIHHDVKLGELLSPVTRRWYLKKKLLAAEVAIYEGISNVVWEEEQCRFKDKQDQEVYIGYDLVVMESKKSANTASVIDGDYISLVIGDAKEPQNAYFAIKDGYETALSIGSSASNLSIPIN
jgi:2,4-dienoyl-CoA reductase-like NADH-dependent reductase (Old Yellow Enzyme family)/thioredoxin reductase